MTAPDLDRLSRRFERFAQLECHGSSPLYERLALGIAADPDLLALAAPARAGQPTPNLFLGAVHALLLGGVQHPLARFYPSLTPDPEREAGSVPALPRLLSGVRRADPGADHDAPGAD